MTPKIVIFIDLYRSLLHPVSYAFIEAEAALRKAREQNTAVIIGSSLRQKKVVTSLLAMIPKARIETVWINDYG